MLSAYWAHTHTHRGEVRHRESKNQIQRSTFCFIFSFCIILFYSIVENFAHLKITKKKAKNDHSSINSTYKTAYTDLGTHKVKDSFQQGLRDERMVLVFCLVSFFGSGMSLSLTYGSDKPFGSMGIRFLASPTRRRKGDSVFKTWARFRVFMTLHWLRG